MTTPTSTEPAAMPHPNNDPDFAAARQARAEFDAAVHDARHNPRYVAFSEINIAEMIEKAHTTYTTAVQDAWNRVNERLNARREWLAAQVPTGHGIADDTSPADRVALMAAFRGHYERAAGLDMKGRAQMLDDADRFGDEPARRAALTAIIERGESTTLQRRPDRYATLAAHLDELVDLQHGGGRIFHGFARQTFTQAPQPKEVIQLPALREAAEAKRQQRLAQRARGW
jgi:hypothetical protein